MDGARAGDRWTDQAPREHARLEAVTGRGDRSLRIDDRVTLQEQADVYPKRLDAIALPDLEQVWTLTVDSRRQGGFDVMPYGILALKRFELVRP